MLVAENIVWGPLTSPGRAAHQNWLGQERLPMSYQAEKSGSKGEDGQWRRGVLWESTEACSYLKKTVSQVRPGEYSAPLPPDPEHGRKRGKDIYPFSQNLSA